MFASFRSSTQAASRQVSVPCFKLLGTCLFCVKVCAIVLMLHQSVYVCVHMFRCKGSCAKNKKQCQGCETWLMTHSSGVKLVCTIVHMEYLGMFFSFV